MRDLSSRASAGPSSPVQPVPVQPVPVQPVPVQPVPVQPVPVRLVLVRRVLWAGLAAAVALLVASCGGDVDDPAAVSGADDNPAPAESASTDTGDELVPGLETAVDQLIGAGVPGAVVMVVGPDGSQTVAAGLADPATGEPMTADHRFPVGGLTTSWVAASMLEMEAEGLVVLGDSLESHLPDRFDYAWDVALYDLLQHTSGIPDHLSQGAADGGDQRDGTVVGSCLVSGRCAWETEDLVALVADLPPAFGPGEGWGYSNTNYALVGEIIESITGASWYERVRADWLDPLGLHATVDANAAFAAGFDIGAGPVATGHRAAAGERGAVDRWVPTGSGAEGSLVSTAADVMGFFRPLLSGDLLDDAQQLALTATAPTSFGHEDYGLGVSFTFGFFEPQVGNTGEAVGWSSFVEHNRDTDVTTVILLNQSGDVPVEAWGELLRVSTATPGRTAATRAADSGPGQLRFYCTLDPALLDG